MTKSLLIAMAGAILSSGCASDLDAGRTGLNRTEIGGRIGTVLGAGAGELFGGDRQDGGLDALEGVMDSGAVAAYMDHQRQEMQHTLQGTGIEVRRTAENTLTLGMSNRFFAYESADITSEAQAMLDSVANVLNLYSDTTVNVVGYSDDAGLESDSLALSKRRVAGIAAYLAQHGVAYSRLNQQGLEQNSPKQANGSEVNRRLEIAIVANPNAGALPSSYSASQAGYLPPTNNNPR